MFIMSSNTISLFRRRCQLGNAYIIVDDGTEFEDRFNPPAVLDRPWHDRKKTLRDFSSSSGRKIRKILMKGVTLSHQETTRNIVLYDRIMDLLVVCASLNVLVKTYTQWTLKMSLYFGLLCITTCDAYSLNVHWARK